MVGLGFDSHRLADGEVLVLGGVKIESSFGSVAHSDGDALYHALVDALLGAAALGDIGEHFPDTDPRYKNADSSIFVSDAIKLIEGKGYNLVNIDATILLEKPKLSPYKDQIRSNISALCHLPEERINVKAKSGEKIGFVVRGEGVAALCICELIRP